MLYQYLPFNINYSFNFGIILLVVLAFQLASGVLLVFFYSNSLEEVFSSMNYLFMDVYFGSFLRIFHCVGANLFFFFIFLHIFKSFFFSSNKNLLVISSGIVIFFLLCAIAFLGYVLPWGQMSLWGATVITNLLSVLPFSSYFLLYIWGNFSVSNATMLKFFSLHYIMPFILLVLVLFHFNILHIFGSSSPSFSSLSTFSFVSFFPLFIIVDFFAIFFFVTFFIYILFFQSYFFFEADNFIIANSLVTPAHIKPEWYFLYSYAILRVFTSKSVGVLFLVISLLCLFVYSFVGNFRRFLMVNSVFIVCFIVCFIILTHFGGCVVAFPFDYFSVIFVNFLFFYLFSYLFYNLLYFIYNKF